MTARIGRGATGRLGPVAPRSTNVAEECVDDVRVERGATAGRDMGPRVGRRQGQPVGPIARQRVEDICDGDNAPLQRNLLAGEPARIAGAVPALVVRPRDDGRDVPQLVAGAGAQLMADLRVALHLDTLQGVERAGLSEPVSYTHL